MFGQTDVILLTIDRPADDEGFSSWFDVHKNVG
jgi:hypothetical protein